MVETLFNAHPTRAAQGTSILLRGQFAVRSVHAAVLEMAGDQGAALGSAQYHHNGRYSLCYTTKKGQREVDSGCVRLSSNHKINNYIIIIVDDGCMWCSAVTIVL